VKQNSGIAVHQVKQNADITVHQEKQNNSDGAVYKLEQTIPSGRTVRRIFSYNG